MPHHHRNMTYLSGMMYLSDNSAFIMPSWSTDSHFGSSNMRPISGLIVKNSARKNDESSFFQALSK